MPRWCSSVVVPAWLPCVITSYSIHYTKLYDIYISGRFEQRWVVAAIMAAALACTLYALGYVGVPRQYLVVAAMLVTLGLCWKLRLNYALGAIVATQHLFHGVV